MSNVMPVKIQSRKDSRFVYFSLMFIGGTCIENKETLGISHLIEHLLLNLDEECALTNYFDADGVAINGTTSREFINFYGYFMRDKKEQFIKKIINDVFFEDFDLNILNKNKKIVACEIDQYKNMAKQELAENKILFKGSLWENDVRGSHTNINLFSEDLVRAVRKQAIDNGQFVLALRGDITYKELTSYMEPFCIKKAGSKLPVKARIREPFQFDNTSYQNETVSGEGKYSDISITYRLDNLGEKSTYASLAVFSAMFSGLDHSVLMVRLREELHMVYQVISYPELFHSFGFFRVKARTVRDNAEQVIREITQLLQKFCDKSYEVGELFWLAKKRVYNEVLLQEENDPMRSTSALAKSVLFGYPSNSELLNALDDLDYDTLRSNVTIIFGKLEKCVFINEI